MSSSSTPLGLNGILRVFNTPLRAPVQAPCLDEEPEADLDCGERLVSRWKRASTHQLSERLVHLIVSEVIVQKIPLPACRHINGSDDAL
jgi:hypothetical protein